MKRIEFFGISGSGKTHLKYQIKKNLKGNYPDKFNRKKLIQNFIDQIKDTSIKPILTLKE